MDLIKWKDIPVIEPAKGGYWEIYDDGRKIWHENQYPQNYKPNEEDDVVFPEPDEIDLINQELNSASQEDTMKIKPPSDYVVPNIDIKDGEYIKILNEGEYRKLPQDQSREVLTFRVETPNGDEKNLSMNPTSQKELILAWGDDSKKWIGKRCKADIVKQKVFDKMKDVIYLHPEGGAPSIPEEDVPDEPEEPEEG